MKIALVDDDAAFLEEFQRLLSLNPREKGITVVSFSSSNAFLSAPLASFDAFFLDVYVDEKDGISLARILRKEMTNPLIVFVTSSGDKAVDAFALDGVSLFYLEWG